MDEENKEVIENKVLDDSTESRRNVKEVKFSKNKKILIIVVVAIVLLIVSYLITASLMTDDVQKESVIIEETNISFSYDTKGLVKNEDDTLYIMQEGISISNISVTDKLIGDKVEKDDVLINYTETIEEAAEATEKFPSKPGYVININYVDNEVSLRTGLTFNVQVSGYEPSVGDCAIIVVNDLNFGTNYTFNAKVTDIFSISGRGANVTLNVIDNGKVLPESYSTETYFENSERSATYDCEDFELSGGKIVVPNVGMADPQHIESNSGIFEEIIKVYDDSFELPGADYEFVDQTMGSYLVGDYLTTSDELFTFNWKKMKSTDKTINSEFDGVIKEIVIDDNKKVEITVYDNSKNYLEFEIEEEYKDKISKNMEVVVKKGDTETTTNISDIQDDVASIEHSRFLSDDLEDEYDISINVSDETVLLIPIEYVKNGKVKKEVDGKFKEVTITYEEYNDEKYKVLTGLSSGDKVEKY